MDFAYWEISTINFGSYIDSLLDFQSYSSSAELHKTLQMTEIK